MTSIETIGSRPGPAATPLALGGRLSALGALGVLATSAFYILSPRAAAGPVQPLDLAAAMAGAVSGVQTLRAAGTVGVFGDLIWATGALAIAGELARRNRALSAAGWIAVFLSIVIFTLVDAMTGFVLPQLAAAGQTGTFEGFKRLWDLLFLLGTLAYGAGAVMALAGDIASPSPMINRPLAWTALGVALAGALGAASGFMGFAEADRIAGASIALGSALFIVISLQIARGDRPG